MTKIIIFLACFCFQNVCCQENAVGVPTVKPKKKYDFAFSPGVILQGKDFFGEANILIGKVMIEKAIVGMGGLRLGAESNFKSGPDFMVAPKIGLEVSATMVSARFSAVNYFQNGESEFWAVPEIGISYGGFANLTYGYGFRLNDSDIGGLSKHRLTLSFNINKKLIGEGLPLL